MTKHKKQKKGKKPATNQTTTSPTSPTPQDLENRLNQIYADWRAELSAEAEAKLSAEVRAELAEFANRLTDAYAQQRAIAESIMEKDLLEALPEKAETKGLSGTPETDKQNDLIDKQILGPIASLIYEKLKTLPKYKGMTSPEIADWLNKEHRKNLDESTLRKNHLKQLIPYGLQHKKRIGYFLPDK